MKFAITLTVLAATLTPVQQQSLRTSTAGVLIDVTVLDKDGRPVTDLFANDFEIREDGKPQRIISVTLMKTGVPVSLGGTARIPRPPAPPIIDGAAEPPSELPAAPTPTITAILFESLSADTRPHAAKAAAELVSTLAPPNEYAGVFLGGLAFKTVQGFTNEPPVVRSALNRVAISAPNDMNIDREQTRTSSRIAGLDPSTPVTAGAEYGRGSTTIAEREKSLTPQNPQDTEARLRQMEYRMEESYKDMLAELEGDAALAGLRTAVQAMTVMPGRKSILYFTEGLPITARLKSHFDALIGEANRANITIYPVDAVGLRVQSKEAEVGRNVNLAGAQGIGDAHRERGAWTKDLEKQEELMSSRPVAALGRLANETGGFLIDNTNDLSKGVARMQVERTTYYLLGYQPTNTVMDGKFRKVGVKVKRGNYTIRARPGYIAEAR
jgi:VWFA-related protein